MRQIDLFDPLVLAIAIMSIAGRRLFAPPVHGQNGGLVVGASKKCAGFMRKVMFHELPALDNVLQVRSGETSLQMVRYAVSQLARRVNNIGKKQWVPGRSFSLGMASGRRFHRKV